MLQGLARERWERIAPTYGAVERFIERYVFGPWRVRVWSLVRGPHVLEAGVGTGSNMPYYPAGVQVTAFDVSAERVEWARQRAVMLGLDVDLRVMDAEHLEFPAEAFDTVVATWVFCWVPNPVPALRHLARVAKRDGQMVLLEHVRIDRPVIGRLMDWFDPWAVSRGMGHFNRRTVAAVRQAGLHIESIEDLAPAGLVKLIVARPGPPKGVGRGQE